MPHAPVLAKRRTTFAKTREYSGEPSMMPHEQLLAEHRTRREFQLWSTDLAERCGYEVRFEGIGTALDEEEVLKQAKKAAEVGDIGCASQVTTILSFPFSTFPAGSTTCCCEGSILLCGHWNVCLACGERCTRSTRLQRM